MADTLVARVAERLDIEPDQTDRVLQTLAQLIKKQSARDGRVRVPGLGVFEQTGESLSFEPDAALAEAVNAQYANLEPVPLPAAEAPIIEEPLDEETDEPEASLLVTDDDAPDAPPAEEEDVALDDSVYDDPDASEAAAYAEDAEHESAEEARPSVIPEEHPVETYAPPSEWAVIPSSPEAQPTSDDTLAAEPSPFAPSEPVAETPPEPDRDNDLPPAPPKRQPRRPRMAPPDDEKRAAWPWLLGVLVLIIAAVVAFFYLRPDPEPTLATPTTQAPPEDDLPVAADDPAEADPVDDVPATGEDTPAEEPAETPAEESVPAGPLRIDRAQGGYTLIVGSNTSQAGAERTAEQFRQRLDGRSLPVDVLQGEARGVTRYRVAVGQVESIEAARELLADLGNAMPDGTWITRILPDS